ncbi:hypothetical protein V9R52_003744 [Vibrio mimicus]
MSLDVCLCDTFA